MATCNDCIHQYLCDIYANAGVTDVPADDITICEVFKNKADVVEVIRCKDCAHYGGITFGNICRRWSGLNVKNCTKPDDFCSYGERKDGDEK